MDVFKNLIDKRRRTIDEDEARSRLLALGEDFLSSVSANDIEKFLVKFGVAHEDDLAKASEEDMRASLKEWLAPPGEGTLVDADGKSFSATETSSGKTSDNPLNLVLEKLESFSSRLSALEGGNLSNSSEETGGWLDQLTKDAQRAVSESGFHVGSTRTPRNSRFAHRNRSGSSSRAHGAGGRSIGRSVTNLQPPLQGSRGYRQSPLPDPEGSRDRRGFDDRNFQYYGGRRIHAAEGPEFLRETFWSDTLNRFNSVRSRVDHANWTGDKMRREATTLAVVLDLLDQGRLNDLEEVLVRRLTALEIADSKGGRKDAWKLARHFESALTTDRIVVDPAAMRHARKCLKLDRVGDRSSSDSDTEPRGGRQTTGRGRGNRG